MEYFSIDAVKVSNFKVFSDYSVDFSNKNLVVFSGPNGFGKTTIFDALELAFTGNIDRFKDIESATGCDDILVAREQGKPVIVEVSLSSDKQKLKIYRSLKKQYLGNNGNKLDKKTVNFETLWQLHISDGSDVALRSIHQSELEKLLGQSELARYYNLFYYVRQEDTAHFLKRSEKERLVEISRLFDTAEEENAWKKLELAKRKVNVIKKNIEKNRDNYKKELATIDSTKKAVTFERLLHSVEVQWDTPDVVIDDFKIKEQITNELQRIKSIIKHREEFIRNRKFLHVLSQTDTQVSTIYIGKFIHNIDQIINNYELKNEIETFISNLNVEKLTEAETLDLEIVSKHIPGFNATDFIASVTELKRLKNAAKSTASICQQLLDIRGKLVSVFEGGADIAGNECPLCGYNWGKHSSVLQEIDKKKASLMAYLTEEQSSFQKMREQFEGHVLQLIVEKMKAVLSSNDFHISKSSYDALKTHSQHKDIVSRFLKWICDNEINIDDLFLNTLSQEINHDEVMFNVEKLKSKIREKNPTLSEEFQAESQLNGFENVFRSFFNGYDNLNAVSIQDVDRKIMYIEYKYASCLEKKRQSLLVCEEQILKLDRLDREYKRAIDTFKSEIGKHRKAIIKDIEIPFFIYSGKILQSIRDGSTGGVYIKDPSPGEELKNIRFVSDWKSDHDVINTTSSGQLSGIIIALTLAMNKVYSRGLTPIFIDDPVQTMDDINIVSLVDLLRHEFKDKQVFLSTHEEDFERFVLYKYLMQKREVKKVNVMTRKEY